MSLRVYTKNALLNGDNVYTRQNEFGREVYRTRVFVSRAYFVPSGTFVFLIERDSVRGRDVCVVTPARARLRLFPVSDGSLSHCITRTETTAAHHRLPRSFQYP